MREGRPVTKGLLRRNLEMFKYLLSVGLWEYNCEQIRTVHSGPPPKPARGTARESRGGASYWNKQGLRTGPVPD